MSNDNETMEQVAKDLCEYIYCRDGILYSLTGKEAIEYKDRFLAAHQHEIAAKDSEIESLKDKNTEAFKAMLKRDKEIARLRALVGKMADALDEYRDAPCNCCTKLGCQGIEKCKETKGRIELVAKARKVKGGVK